MPKPADVAVVEDQLPDEHLFFLLSKHHGMPMLQIT